MLLHTAPATGVLTVFPGVPGLWADAAFHQLRARGGTALIRVAEAAWEKGLAAEPAGTSVHAAGGAWNVTLPAAQPVLLYPSGGPVPDFIIAPVAGNASERNWFGYTRAMQPLH
eukprot:gene56389-63437_t